MFKNIMKLGFEITKLMSLIAVIILAIYGIIHFLIGI